MSYPALGPAPPALHPLLEHRRVRDAEGDGDVRWEGEADRDARLMLELQQLMHEYV